MLNIAEMQYNLSAIRNMGEGRRDAFVSSAVCRLAQVDLSIPGHTRLFHPAALVYWALEAMKLE